MMDWLMGSIAIYVDRLLLNDVKHAKSYGIVHKNVKRVIGRNIREIVNRNRSRNRSRSRSRSRSRNQK